jgi:hypothetical protein
MISQETVHVAASSLARKPTQSHEQPRGGGVHEKEGHWAIVDLVGKAAHVRTVPMPDWVKEILDHG